MPLFVRIIIWMSALWYPVFLLIFVLAIALLAAQLPDEQLSELVRVLFTAGFWIPIVFFVAGICTNDWFRRRALWILLLWIAMVFSAWITPGALNRLVIVAVRAIQKQLAVTR
jgi:hypothetical protein